MDWKTISGILQVVLPAALAYAVGKGWITSSQVGEITAAIITLGGAVWSAYTNHNASPPAPPKQGA